MGNNKDVESLKRLAARIKEVRQLKGIIQEDPALKLNADQKQVWRIKQGLVDPIYGRLNGMSTIFEMIISELLQISESTGIKTEEQQ